MNQNHCDTKPLIEKGLENFVGCYSGQPCSGGLRPPKASAPKGAKKKSAMVADRRYSRTEADRFKRFTCDEIAARGKANLVFLSQRHPPKVTLEEFRGVEETLTVSNTD